MIQELSTPPPGSSELYFPTKYSLSFLNQCLACLWKMHLSYWRNPPYNAIRLFFTTVIALLFGTIFWDLGGKTYVPYLVHIKHMTKPSSKCYLCAFCFLLQGQVTRLVQCHGVHVFRSAFYWRPKLSVSSASCISGEDSLLS